MNGKRQEASVGEVPQVGDLWKDLDPRSKGREIKILSVHLEGKVVKAKSVGGGPTTTIRADRFKASRALNGNLGKKGFVLLNRPSNSISVSSSDVEAETGETYQRESPTGTNLAAFTSDLGSAHDDA